jgi:hypothetical protein
MLHQQSNYRAGLAFWVCAICLILPCSICTMFLRQERREPYAWFGGVDGLTESYHTLFGSRLQEREAVLATPHPRNVTGIPPGISHIQIVIHDTRGNGNSLRIGSHGLGEHRTGQHVNMPPPTPCPRVGVHGNARRAIVPWAAHGIMRRSKPSAPAVAPKHCSSHYQAYANKADTGPFHIVFPL